MDRATSSKKVDALIARILQLCEDEGASITEVRMLAQRFEGSALRALEDAGAKALFKYSPANGEHDKTDVLRYAATGEPVMPD